jgi:two-component system, OmpR family, sensor histidine kinase RstB
MIRQLIVLYVIFVLLYYLSQTAMDLAILSYYDQELDEDRAKDVAGLYMALEALHPLIAPSDWQVLLQQMSEHSSLPVAVKPLTHWQLSDRANGILLEGGIWVSDNDKLIAFKKISSTLIARIGPLKTIETLSKVDDIFFLIYPMVLLGVMTLIWTSWLQYRLVRLEEASVAFSNGNLNFRAPLGHLVLGNLNQSFNSMADRLQRLFLSHKHLTNAVSHELRSPIGRIRFHFEMLTNQEKSVGERGRDKHLVGISEDIDEMESLVEELLTYAKMERTEPLVTLDRIDFNQWLIEQRERLSVETQTRIELVLPRMPVQASIDQVLMYRLLRNLVCNADNFADQKLVVGFDVNEGNCQLWIDDDGPGIAKDQRESLFEPFTRVDISRNKNHGGFGLGLAIAAQIARCHHGCLSIHTSRYGGARLLLEWPK